MSETSSNEQDRSQVVSEQCSMGIRLMIIELRKYNEIGELLIENRTTGSQAQVSHRDKVREASVTRAAVCMGVKGTQCKQDTGAHTISLRIGIKNRYAYGTVEQS